MKMKRTAALCLALVLSLGMALTGTIAYLQDTDEDVNVMTLGNVQIDQLEYERVVENGAWKPADKADGYGFTPDLLQEFADDKPLYPAYFADGKIKWDDRADGHYQSWGQVGAPGNNQLFDDSVKGALDKFVFVKNTGSSDAYVRTWFAFEQGDLTAEEFDALISTNINGVFWSWETFGTDVDILGTKHVVMIATYVGPQGADGVVKPGEVTRPSLLQVYMSPEATNEDVAKLDKDGDGKYNIHVKTQAVQTTNFPDAKTALEAAFGKDLPFAEPIDVPADGKLELEGGTVFVDKVDQPLTIGGSGTIVIGSAEVQGESGQAGLVIEPDSDVTVSIQGEATFTGGAGGDGITVPAGSKLTLQGPGTLKVEGGGSDEKGTTTSGSGIGGAGDIVIKGIDELEAIGHGIGASGIGGDSSNITIEDTHITKVVGGMAKIYYPEESNFYKEEPEGSPAIGSNAKNVVINLKDVVIDEAIGGSKAAGIGARFWCSADITIENCVIKHAEGGISGAGIGGSRVANEDGDNTWQTVTIRIHNSTVNAIGGSQAAGIGSGYDTYCHRVGKAPMTEIVITGNSDITAVGGKFSAGIGTGYHAGLLSGRIESSVKVNATGDTIHYKKSDGDDGVYSYTIAQDVGFGMLDLTREGKDNLCTFDYKGTIITVPEAFVPTADNTAGLIPN